MKNQRIIVEDDEHRVLQFRPRNAPAGTADSARPQPGAPTPPTPIRRKPIENLQSPAESQEAFRHRMLANGAALLFTVALLAFGFWLATSIADMRRAQDCILSGRHNCAPVAAPQG